MVKDVSIPKMHLEDREAMTRCVKIEDAQVYLLLKFFFFYIKCLKDVWHSCNIQMVVAVLI